MSGDAALPSYSFDTRGPAQRRLLEWLQAQVDMQLESAVAQRSPAGPWAIKLYAPGCVPKCAELLQAEAWVDRVAMRPQHLYVRVTTAVLCEWVAEGFATNVGDHVGGSEGRGRSVLVRAVDVNAMVPTGAPRPLRMFRETAVARSVAALLRSRGFDVQLELLPPGCTSDDEMYTAAPGSITHTVVVGPEVPLRDGVERDVVHLPVSEVDVRHGPLRARNGGSVSADDVVAEIARMQPAERPSVFESKQSAMAYGEAVLALLLLATPRTRRIQLDDPALQREAAVFGCLVELLADAEHDDGSATDHLAPGEPVRDLAAELDLIATNAGRAVTMLDPALVTRCLRSMAERWEGLAAADDVAAPLQLRAAMHRGTRYAFLLAALAVPEEAVVRRRCARRTA